MRFYAMLIAMLVGLSGCGGGGDSSPLSQVTVSGVAATGAPLAGIVYLRDSSAPAKEVSKAIAADGSFSFDVTNLTAPFLLKAIGTSGGRNYTLYSFASGAGTANVNPLSHLSTVRAYGSDNLSALYAATDPAAMLALKQKITAAIIEIQNLMSTILAQYGVTNVNYITDTFSANHQGLDLLFDMISIDITGGVVTIRNVNTSTVIYTSLANTVLSGQINIANVPAPPVQIAVAVFVTPGTASAVVNNNVTFSAVVTGTSNQQVTWSVVETNGGSITSAGIYTAPSSAGTFHVKATSVADNTRSVTSAVTVTSSTASTSSQIWRTSGVTPAVTFTVGSKLGTNNTGTITYYSGSIQSSFLGNGVVNINSISNTSYICQLPDGSWLVATVVPTDATGDKFIMIGTSAVTANTTTLPAYLGIANGFTFIYNGAATFIRQ